MGKITDDELDGMTDEERAAIEDEDSGADEKELTPEQLKALERDDGKEDEGEGDAPGVAAAAATTTATAANAATGDSDSGQDDGPVDIPLSPVFTAREGSDFDAQLAALKQQEAELHEKYTQGEIDPAEYRTQLSAVSDQRLAVVSEKTKVEVAEQMNSDIEAARYHATIEAFKASVKASTGIDYDANPALLDQWDAEIKRLAADEAHDDKSYRWFLQTAHEAVVAQQLKIAESMGLVPKDGARRPNAEQLRTALAARTPTRPKVGSLATVPSAAGEQPGQGEFAHLDSLEGEELEMAVARMTPEQQARWAAAS